MMLLSLTTYYPINLEVTSLHKSLHLERFASEMKNVKRLSPGMLLAEHGLSLLVEVRANGAKHYPDGYGKVKSSELKNKTWNSV